MMRLKENRVLLIPNHYVNINRKTSMKKYFLVDILSETEYPVNIIHWSGCLKKKNCLNPSRKINSTLDLITQQSTEIFVKNFYFQEPTYSSGVIFLCLKQEKVS